MRISLAFISLTVAVGTLGCKPRQQSAVKAEDGTVEKPVDPAARDAVQAVQAACGNDSATLLRGTGGDHVDFVAVYEAPVEGKDHDDFFERAAFADGKWQLSSAIRDAKSPACVAGRMELSTEELIGALRCAGVDPCRSQTQQNHGACEFVDGKIAPVDGKGGPEIAFTDLRSCEDLVASEHGFRGLEDVAVASPPRGENHALPDAGGAETGIALTANSFAWAQYGDPARAFHLTKTSYGGELQFKPDTLYSWGPFAKLDWLARQSWTGKLTRDYRDSPLFATTSPFGSFGYGDVAIRLKIKPYGVKYKYISEYPFRPGRAREYCNDDVDVDNTIVVRYWDNGAVTGLDYILCGLGPVHSWSWGTREAYNEMAAEVTWLGRHNYRDYELYVKQQGVDMLYPRIDGNNPSAQKWQNNMSYHYSRGFGSAAHQNNRGLIYYNPSVGSASEEAHFQTNSPVYFNEE